MEKKASSQQRYLSLQAVNNENGIVLILTLAVVFILAVLAWEFTNAMLVEETIGNNYQNALKANCMAKSGVQYALSLLQQAGDEYRVYSEEWDEISPPLSFDEGELVVKIMDEGGKLLIDSQVKEESENGQNARASVEMLLSLLEIEISDLTQFYQNAPYRSPGELFAASSLKLEDYLTVFSNGKVNINTAGAEVLQSISSKLDKDLVDSIISRRQSEPFQSVSDLQTIEGIDEETFNEIESRLTVTSTWYSIYSKATLMEIEQVIKAVVNKDGEKFKFVYWRIEG
jgi:general secretion pathway protein K